MKATITVTFKQKGLNADDRGFRDFSVSGFFFNSSEHLSAYTDLPVILPTPTVWSVYENKKIHWWDRQ